MKRVERRTWFLLALTLTNAVAGIVFFVKGNASAGVGLTGIALLGCVRVYQEATGMGTVSKKTIE